MESESILNTLFTQYQTKSIYDPQVFEPFHRLILDRPISEQDELFRAVWGICGACEKEAFFQGVRTGVRLVRELQ